MKKLFLLILLSILLKNTSAEWKTIAQVPLGLFDCFCITDNVYIAVGSTGAIYKSTDAGVTWLTKASGTIYQLNSVHFINTKVGIAVGDHGTIIRTTDGGNTWTPRVSGTTMNLWSVSFCDSVNGYIAGQGGTMFRTANAGLTWYIKNTGTTTELKACHAVFPWLCYAVGINGIILKTTNGGTSWFPLTSPTANDLRGVAFINSSTGFAVGVQGTIIKTTNGGISWNLLNQGEYYLNAVFILSSTQLVTVGEFGIIMRSEDAGAHWITQPTDTDLGLWGLYFTSASTGIVVGHLGIILKTVDASLSKPVVRITYPHQGLCEWEECLNVPQGWFFDALGTASADPGLDVISVQLKIDSGAWQNVNPPYASWSHPIDLSGLQYPYGPHIIYVRAMDNTGRWSEIDSSKFSVTASFPHYRHEMKVVPLSGYDGRFAARGQEFTIGLYFDNRNDNNLWYVSFEFLYTHPEMLEYLGYEVPPFLDSTAVTTIVPEPDKGKISYAIYNDPRLTDGNWLDEILLRLKFRVKKDAWLGQHIVFYFQNQYEQDNTSRPIVGIFSRIFISNEIDQWPGDANNNGKVEITDINSIVNNWNKTGAPLPGMYTWQAYRRNVWNNYPEATASDGDGNGLVNIKDIDPVIRFLGYEHGIKYEVPAILSGENPPLAITAGSQISGNGEISYDIYLGNEEKPVDKLKVLSFELKYNSESLEYLGNERGAFLSGAGALVIPEHDSGKVNVSIYNSEGAHSGYGNIMRLKFRAKDNKKGDLKLRNILANSEDGSVLPLTAKYLNSTVNVEKPVNLPSDFYLHQNYPNPFNPVTNIAFCIPVESQVSLMVYDALGNEVLTLVNEFKQAGNYNVKFDGSNIAGGIYFYRLKAEGFSAAKKLIIVK